MAPVVQGNQSDQSDQSDKDSVQKEEAATLELDAILNRVENAITVKDSSFEETPKVVLGTICLIYFSYQ